MHIKWLPTVVVLSLLQSLTGFADQEERRMVLFDFRPETSLAGWEVEDDVVMGGRSAGRLTQSPEGHAVFSGTVSLDNNGGFSSIQAHFDPIPIAGYHTAHLRVKGDGKRYLFLVEADANARHYYVSEFQTSGEWETVTVPMHEMIPVRRGDRLDLPNFPGKTLAQVRLMIANQTRESFQLEVARIWLE